MRKKVAINIRTLHSQQIRGFSRYVMNLISSVKEHNNIELFFVSEVAIDESYLDSLGITDNLMMNTSGRSSFVWLHFLLPGLLKKNNIDVYHAPGNTGIPFLHLLGVGSTVDIVTIHDLISFADMKHGKWNIEKILFTFNWLCNRACRHILTVSEFSAGEIRQLYPRKEVTSIYNVVDESFFLKNDLAHADAHTYKDKLNSYFFYVGGFEERKNIEGLLSAYRLYWEQSSQKRKFLVGGGLSDDRKEELKNLLGNDCQVSFLGYIPDEDLPGHYQEAFATVIASFSEGFGLQVAESLAGGTPVLCSNKTSLPEVGGRGAVLFDPSDSSDIASKMLRLETDEVLYKNKVELCEREGKRFRSNHFAQQYVSFLTSLDKRVK